MIKAIETFYNGYRFRSRLEARWAVFFDALGLEYVYEAEGFTCSDGTRYLPDFWFPHMDAYVEIKPTKDAIVDEQQKLLSYIVDRGYLTVCAGVPGNHQTHTWAVLPVDDPRILYDTCLGKRWQIRYRFPDGKRVLAHEERKDAFPYLWRIYALSKMGKLSPERPATKERIRVDIARAIAAARSARFEFGEAAR